MMMTSRAYLRFTILICLFWLSKAYYIPESRRGPQVLHPRMFGHGGLRPALESSAYAKNLTGKREIKPSNSSANSSLPNFVVYSDRWTSNIGPPPVSEIKVCFRIHVIKILFLIYIYFQKGFNVLYVVFIASFFPRATALPYHFISRPSSARSL